MNIENLSKKKNETSPIFKQLNIFSDSLKNQEIREMVNSSKLTSFSTNSNFNPETGIFTQNVPNLSNELKSQNTNLLENSTLENLPTETTEKNPISASSKLNGYSKIQELKLVKIGLASSEKIVEWAEKILLNGKIFGEVLNANTLHYKTFKPHKGGLFCERIFGPLKDFECACGKTQKPFEEDGYVQNILDSKHSKRLFCPECDVEYTWSVIRRYQLGYIKLVSPVSHLWYLRTNPSYLSLLLDIKKRDLESIIYCMQITTLEYYWRPLHSVQINLTPTSLLNSYKKCLSLDQKTLTKQTNIQKKHLQKKYQKEVEKRQKVCLLKKAMDSTQDESQIIKSFENESLEKQIQYLEKSFQLNIENVYPIRIPKNSKIKDFLKEKGNQNLKKRTFLTVYKTSNKRFYQEIYYLISRRIYLSLSQLKIEYSISELTLFLENKANLKKFNNTNHKPFSNLKYILKIALVRNAFKSKFLGLNFVEKNEEKNKLHNPVISRHFFPVWTKNKGYFYKKTNQSKTSFTVSNEKTSSTFQKQHFYKNSNKEFQSQTNFINSFISLLHKTNIKTAWGSIFNNKKHFIRIIFNLPPTHLFKTRLTSVIQLPFFQNIPITFFLYLLYIIQTTCPLFFKTSVSLNFRENLVQKILVSSIANRITSLNSGKEISEYLKLLKNKEQLEILSKFLETPLIAENNKKTLLFVEIEEFLENPKNNLIKYLNIVVNSITKNVFRISSSEILKKYLKKSSKEYRIVLLNNEGEKRFIKPEKALSLQNLFSANCSKREVLSPFNQFLFNKLTQEKKIPVFLKFQSTNFSESQFYLKYLKNMMKNLSLFKHHSKSSSFNLYNNIYTVAYSTGWQTEKDWRYFLYYNTAPIEMDDQRLSFYGHRFVSDTYFDYSFSKAIPIFGANLVQKLLHQYESLELKKMAKQHQNILPKVNRYIRNLKQLAQKKSDFLQIQKLLQKRDEIIRRLKLLRKLFKKNVKPSATILTTLPVLPPDLRPILKMQNQIAASDLNRFYQRILYRNERLKKFLRANSSMLNYEPGFELKYAQRLLQEAVDNLIQNGKGNVKPETNSRGQPLKSLSEILKGKQGRFRQYLLGKRVDYSGRSVIVVGPTLKIYQCGLPFEMAMELFLPFLIKRIFQYRLARTVIGAKTILKTQKKVTWDLLEEIMQSHPILLNRAPTLHRLGIQAFQPKLIEGRAILLHPLVCPAFNADFDGDQMAVHLPITVEARTEAWKLMFSRNHLISPATGEPMLLPSQDMVLGCYYLTTESLQTPRFHNGRPFFLGTRFYFSNMQQVLLAYQQQKIHLQTPIWIKWNGLIEMEHHFSTPLEIRLNSQGSWTELRPKMQKRLNPQGICESFFVRTTAGRVLLNTIINNCIQNA